jgi:hypothetical protein
MTSANGALICRVQHQSTFSEPLSQGRQSTRCPRNCPVTKSCNIGDNARPLTDAMKSDLEPLIRQGYAELVQDQPASPYRLTAKGITLLSERGAGLNEA